MYLRNFYSQFGKTSYYCYDFILQKVKVLLYGYLLFQRELWLILNNEGLTDYY